MLVNNAGVVRTRGLTKQGFELMFGVNHLGHFVLTNALLGCLEASAPARVVTVASDSHYAARGIDWDALRRPERGVTGLRGYAVSKLCNVLFSAELGRRTAGTGVTTYALHPGVVASDIWRRVPWPVRPLITRRMLTVEQGAETSLYCATSPSVASASGLFYDKCAEREPSPWPRPSWPPSCGSAARSGPPRPSHGRSVSRQPTRAPGLVSRAAAQRRERLDASDASHTRPIVPSGFTRHGLDLSRWSDKRHQCGIDVVITTTMWH